MKLKLSEEDVQLACTQLLESDGWRALRTTPVSNKSRACGFGEIGMPDYLYIRYCPQVIEWHDDDMVVPNGIGGWRPKAKVQAEVLWIEYKRPGKSAKSHQQAWMVAEAQRGALVWVVDDIDTFRKDYAANGLARRMR